MIRKIECKIIAHRKPLLLFILRSAVIIWHVTARTKDDMISNGDNPRCERHFSFIICPLTFDMANLDPKLPSRFADLKRDIARSFGPDFQQRVTSAWTEIIEQLKVTTKEIASTGPAVKLPCLSIAFPRRSPTPRMYVDHPGGTALRSRDPELGSARRNQAPRLRRNQGCRARHRSYGVEGGAAAVRRKQSNVSRLPYNRQAVFPHLVRSASLP
jgi:hypothetical protein